MSKYGVLNHRIQSEYRKIRTRKNSVFGHFSPSVISIYSVRVSSHESLQLWNFGIQSVLEIYGSATVGQIKGGKHIYWALEARFELYLALYKLYIATFIDKNHQNHQKTLDTKAVIEFLKLQKEFDGNLKN